MCSRLPPVVVILGVESLLSIASQSQSSFKIFLNNNNNSFYCTLYLNFKIKRNYRRR